MSLGVPHNLLLITASHLRRGSLSCYGNPFIRTESLDALARTGVQLDACYSASPVAGASAASLLTSTRVGEHGYRGSSVSLRKGLPNLPGFLKAESYRTAFFGNQDSLPMEMDVWDDLEIFPRHSISDPAFEQVYSSFPARKDSDSFSASRVTEAWSKFAGGISKRPFFCWLQLADIGPPFSCPDSFASLYPAGRIQLPPTFRQGPEAERPRRCHHWQVHSQMQKATELDIRRAIAAYCGQVAFLDELIRRIMRGLNENNLAGRTVIAFVSENGELLGDYGMFDAIPVFYDCLTRIPAILTHPSVLWKPDRYGGLIESVDLAPTLIEGLGLPVPPEMVGKSVHMQLVRGEKPGREDILCEGGGCAPTPLKPADVVQRAPELPTNFGPAAMIRWSHWKLSMYTDDMNELYNLAEDPLEMFNRYNHPVCQEIRQIMTERLTRRLLGVKSRSITWNGKGRDPRFNPL
ncbi:MAG: sulfatase-like hydrolase/transferase [Planctomycetota bacterium]|nr:sulfatase-like hydrolase/transferase [Planctomycetota bacterium]